MKCSTIVSLAVALATLLTTTVVAEDQVQQIADGPGGVTAHGFYVPGDGGLFAPPPAEVNLVYNPSNFLFHVRALEKEGGKPIEVFFDGKSMPPGLDKLDPQLQEFLTNAKA